MLIESNVTATLNRLNLCWTIFAWHRDTAVPVEGNGDLQTLICVLVARPRRCLRLSNPVPWQNWMAAYLSYTLRMKTLFRGWPVMVNDMHTRRRLNRQQNYTNAALHTCQWLRYSTFITDHAYTAYYHLQKFITIKLCCSTEAIWNKSPFKW